MQNEILVINLVRQSEENLKKTKQIELDHYIKIDLMVFPDGKKVHSNESKRESALKQVLESDKSYQDILEDQKKLREKVDTFKIETDYLKRIFRSIEALVRLENL